jgi:hypothetical protein
MQNVEEKLVLQRQAEKFHALNTLSLGSLQAIVRGLVWQPGATLPNGRVQVDLAMALPRVQIVVLRRNVLQASSEAGFARRIQVKSRVPTVLENFSGGLDTRRIDQKIKVDLVSQARVLGKIRDQAKSF